MGDDEAADAKPKAGPMIPDALTLGGLEGIVWELERNRHFKRFANRTQDIHHGINQVEDLQAFLRCMDIGSHYYLELHDLTQLIESIAQLTKQNVNVVRGMTLSEAVEIMRAPACTDQDDDLDLPRVEPKTRKVAWENKTYTLDKEEHAFFLLEIVKARGKFVTFQNIKKYHGSIFDGVNPTRVKACLLKKFPNRIGSDKGKGYRWVL